MNMTLYKREMKNSVKMLLIFMAVLTLYITLIIYMYSPETLEMFSQFSATMPQMMSAFNMDFSAESLTLLGYMASGLYGFILVIFPMIFSILRGNGLVARYVDRGSMASLLAAPVKRRAVALTQMMVLITGICILIVYATVLQIVSIEIQFPEEVYFGTLMKLNAGLLSLHLFIGGICFLASCIFNDTKNSVGFGAGIPGLMFIIQLLSSAGDATEGFKYATFFTLYNPDGIAAGESGTMVGVAVLFAGAFALFTASVLTFTKKDLSI